ncbi:MAG: YARHG domain-containing protein [Bacteroidetes bacterium]|nr:YARHG domain-containing protein [Bacteroidota bacterium]
MKAKPVFIIFGVLVVITCAFLFFSGRFLSRPKTNEVYAFLQQFNDQLKKGNTDSVLSYFEVNKKAGVLRRLVNVLSNKADFKGAKEVLLSLSLTIEPEDIHIMNNEIASATLPVYLIADSIPTKVSVLKLKVHKTSGHTYKIVHVDANKLAIDYATFVTLVKAKQLKDDAIYDPMTLAAFKTAEQLKGKYDSVVWFAHMDKKTWFYVVKGKWDMSQDIFRYKDTVTEPYKMGLVGPDLKEIIPAEYDLIHNISGTFPGLVEVEKGDKKGFFDLQGKIVIPVNYDQVFPIDDDANLAVLRNGDDYFYLKKDMTISEKTDIKVADFFPKIRKISSAYNLSDNALSVITEYNSRTDHGAIYVPPSYLADLNIIAKEEDFKNPLRKVEFEEVSAGYDVDLSNSKSGGETNWLQASFYSIRDYFLGGRSEFYDKRNMLVIDKKRNRIFGQDFTTDYSPDGGDSYSGKCNIDNIRQVNDSLYEVKIGSILYVQLYDSTKYIAGGPYYHYLVVRNNKMVELPDNRNFGFTKYVKLDDSYMNGCYQVQTSGTDGAPDDVKTVNQLTPEMLRYMKNEIYADYAYKFKDKRWQSVFEDVSSYYDRQHGGVKEGNENVNDSLTVIDKYNINWIVQKLKETQSTTLAAK